MQEQKIAHIFQLSLVALIPMVVLFFATADWSRRQNARPLALSTAIMVGSFGALY